MVKPGTSKLWDRIDHTGETAVVVSTGVPVSEVVSRLEAGEPTSSLALQALDILAALVFEALRDDGPGLVQSLPRHPRLEPALSDVSIGVIFPRLSRPSRLALAAGLLQIHDFWDASHTAAQEADDLGEHSVSSYWHAIAHRREPDPGNASYWFRRVGRHPVSVLLANEARPILEREMPAFTARLISGGIWYSSAFIGLCDPRYTEFAGMARRLQRLEMLHLLEASLPS
jgi:hypothetical protein